jgi:hypothetical protein
MKVSRVLPASRASGSPPARADRRPANATAPRPPARKQAPSFNKIDASALFKSEPNPSWFGNPANSARAKGWDAPNWLTSRFHFSFAEWSAGKPSYGALRVLNDDRVQPSRGFGTHGHANMEICT